MAITYDGNGNLVAFQPSHDEAITNAKLPFKKIGVNRGEDQDFLVHCLVDGDVTFETWGGETVTRSMIAGETYNVKVRKVIAIPGDFSFSAFY